MVDLFLVVYGKAASSPKDRVLLYVFEVRGTAPGAMIKFIEKCFKIKFLFHKLKKPTF